MVFSSYWGMSWDLGGVLVLVLVNLGFSVVLAKAGFVIGCIWKALVVSFATLILTLFTQSTIVSPSGISRVGGLSVSAKRIHQGSMGVTRMPGGPRLLGLWLIFLAGLVGARVFNRVAWLKITNPSGWMAAYINKIEKQRITRKTNMRTMMANKRRHVCLATASKWNSSSLSSPPILQLSCPPSSYSTDGSRLPFRYLNNKRK